MPNGLSNLGSNLFRAANISRRRHSALHTLAEPPPPQHTNVSPLHSNRHSTDVSQLGNNQFDNSKRNSKSIPEDEPVNQLTIEFDGGTHVIVRPNRTVRGKVILNLTERIYATRIRIKFRAEEVALIRLEDGDDSKFERLHESRNVFFEVDWNLWGNSSKAYSQSNWEELDIGKHEFPFALLFPNVNYPPSIEEPKGFGLRYIWIAQLDGPGLQSGLKSREYLTPYRPIIVSTPDRPWEYKNTLLKDKKNASCDITAKLQRQCYCPDEPFLMTLKAEIHNPESKITSIRYEFRKHFEGKVLIQKGTAYREYIRKVLKGVVEVTGSGNAIEQDVEFTIPTRLVSPSFTTQYTRVHYDICFKFLIEHGSIFKTNYVAEFNVPLSIANLPFQHLIRIPELTAIEYYKTNKECPRFFDPELDEPPLEPNISDELMQSIQRVMTSTPREDPPNYFNIPTILPQLKYQKERQERYIYLTRSIKSQAIDLTEATLISGLYEEAW